MRIAVARETRPGETRVALVPELVDRLTGIGYDVGVEPGAGEPAGFADEEYAAAGARLEPGALLRADLVLSVQPLDAEDLRALRRGAAVISLSQPAAPGPVGITAFAMDRVPRISRAQSMDALTSQALVVGYRGVMVAAGMLRRLFPATVTAAGTVPAAEVVVLGTGIVGLQAIATARRLGAVVRAYDVRASSAEEIRSLGAEYLDLGLPPLAGAAGYTRELSAERSVRQAELLAPYVAQADVLVTTAAVPGQPAPVLVTAPMVAAMRPGSVVVDLAAESGGNVEGAVAGETVRIGRTRVWGGADVAAQLPGPASTLYAQNVVALVELMTVDGAFAPDFSDEIVAGCVLTGAGDDRGDVTAPPAPSER